MLLAAAFVVADFVNPNDLKAGKLYPDLSFLRHIGKWITEAVWQDAHRAGVAQVRDLSPAGASFCYCLLVV
jgi:malic enzyme